MHPKYTPWQLQNACPGPFPPSWLGPPRWLMPLMLLKPDPSLLPCFAYLNVGRCGLLLWGQEPQLPRGLFVGTGSVFHGSAASSGHFGDRVFPLSHFKLPHSPESTKQLKNKKGSQRTDLSCGTEKQRNRCVNTNARFA